MDALGKGLSPPASSAMGAWPDLSLRWDERLTAIMVARSPGAAGIEATLGTALGYGQPLERGALVSGENRFIWFAPNQWLVIAAEGAGDLCRRLEGALAGTSAAAIDCSGGMDRLTIEGSGMGRLIRRGTLVDLSDAACPVGRATRLLFTGQSVILVRLEADVFELYVEHTLRPGLDLWLEETFAGPAD